MVRAKFRCMKMARDWRGQLEVEFQPVMKSEKHPENKSWWDATPSGDLKVTYGPEANTSFENGAYYFIDLEMYDEKPSESERPWSLYQLTETKETLTIDLSPRWEHHQAGLITGQLTAGINNKKAWEHFKNQVGSKWRLTFTYACSAADGEE